MSRSLVRRHWRAKLRAHGYALLVIGTVESLLEASSYASIRQRGHAAGNDSTGARLT
jgi:hypothetical protein